MYATQARSPWLSQESHGDLKVVAIVLQRHMVQLMRLIERAVSWVARKISWVARTVTTVAMTVPSVAVSDSRQWQEVASVSVNFFLKNTIPYFGKGR